MRLADWLPSCPGGLSELTRRTGLCYTTVWCCAHGESTPTYETAQLISAATGGSVSIAELCAPVTPKRSRAGAAAARKRKPRTKPRAAA